MLAVGVAHRDLEALAFAGLTVAALLATRWRGGSIGRVGLGLLAVDSLGWMAPAALINAREAERVIDVAVPVLLTALAVALLLAVAGLRPILVSSVAGVLLLSGAAANLAAPDRADRPRAVATIDMRNVAFTPKNLNGLPASIPVYLDAHNGDLFWHTFTVPDLDVSVAVPTGATRSVRIQGPPGTYRFVCAIPGHEQAGMKGTLIIGDDGSM
jgi:hypothetical protein